MNDKDLRNALINSEKSIVAVKDRRGSNHPHNKIDEEPICTYINLFQQYHITIGSRMYIHKNKPRQNLTFLRYTIHPFSIAQQD